MYFVRCNVYEHRPHHRPLGRHPAPAPNPVLRLPFLVELEDMTWVYRFQGEKMEKGRLTFGNKRFIFCYYPCPDCLTTARVKFSTIQLASEHNYDVHHAIMIAMRDVHNS
jgi:hypothetical protein